MNWFWIFGAGFLSGWWMCAATWPGVRAGRRSNGNCVPLPPAPPGPRFDEGHVQRSNRSNACYQPKPKNRPQGPASHTQPSPC
jgi:hypothetical protein